MYLQKSLNGKLITLKYLSLCHVNHQMWSIPSTAQNENSYCRFVNWLVTFTKAWMAIAVVSAMMISLWINTFHCQAIHHQIWKYKSLRKYQKSTKLTKPERKRVELKSIKELGTAARYGLDDRILMELASICKWGEQNWHLQQTSEKEKKPWSSKNNLSF